MATASRVRLGARRTALTRLAVVGAAAAVTATIVPFAAQQASASPHLTLAQVQSRIAVLNGRAERLTEAFDGARDQLATLTRQEQATQDTLTRDRAQLATARSRIDVAAAAAYRAGGLSSAMTVVSMGSPQAYLDQAGSLNAISRVQSDELAAANAAQRQVAAVQAVRTAQLAQQRKTVAAIASNKSQVEGLLGQEQALYGRLKAADYRRLLAARARQRQHEIALRDAYHPPAPAVARPRASQASTASYTGPATGQAATAVKFAYAQLGKPYVYGAAGPNSYDCSGLTMRAWGAAGVGLPHNAAAQQGSIPSVSLSALQPGDLVFFGDPAYHVAIYIGGGRIIQAPHTGADVEITSLGYMTPTSAGRP